MWVHCPILDFLFSFFSSLSNSFYPSIFIQKWKITGKGLLSSSKLLLRKNWRGAYLLRWIRLTCLPKGNHPKKWTIHLRSPRWWRGQLLVRLLPLASCPLSPVRGRGKAWWRVQIPSLKNAPSSSVKTQGMRSSSCHPSSRMTTMSIGVIMLLGPWGRRAYLVWHRYAYMSPFFLFCLIVVSF